MSGGGWPPPSACASCRRGARTPWRAGSPSASGRRRPRRPEPGGRLAAPVGHLLRLPRRRAAHAVRLSPRPAARLLDRGLPAAAVAAGGDAGAGARYAGGIGEAHASPGADGHRVHDPDALPRRVAVPAARLLGGRHPVVAEPALRGSGGSRLDRRHDRLAGADRRRDPRRRSARARPRRLYRDLRAGRPAPGGRARVAPGRSRARRRAAHAGGGRTPRGLPHLLAQDRVSGRSGWPLDRGRDDRARPAHRSGALPGGAVSGAELFDTHTHLHFPEFADDLPAVLARARAAGVTRLVTIGTDVETSAAAIALAGREPGVWASVGIHPHDAEAADETAFAEIERLARAPRVVAIGEIGLDFF